MSLEPPRDVTGGWGMCHRSVPGLLSEDPCVRAPVKSAVGHFIGAPPHSGHWVVDRSDRDHRRFDTLLWG